MAGMISPEEAQARILALGAPVSVEAVPVLAAANRWAASDLTALRTQPARDLSAMDGYAIHFADLPGPWRVIGESAPGSPFMGRIGTGEAVRIFTGAAVPVGADTVVMQENIARQGTDITLTGDAPAFQSAHVRCAGSDFGQGTRLISAGDALSPAALALAVMGGYASLDVRRRIRVAIVSTGDELVLPGTDAGADRLPNSNAPMLAAMLGVLPAEIIDLGIVPDDPDALAVAFGRAHDCDILVTSGGASVGDHDLVRPVLLSLGATLDFWKVAMRPGKPVMAGKLGQTIVLGLPGNPVSAFVTATLFLLPLVRELSGARDALPHRIAAICNTQMPAVGLRSDFIQSRWSGSALCPLPSTDSGVLSNLARADALIVRPATASALAAGAQVEAILLQ